MKAIPPNIAIKIQDRFFIGGPLTLRGFNMKGCGPSQDCKIFSLQDRRI